MTKLTWVVLIACACGKGKDADPAPKAVDPAATKTAKPEPTPPAPVAAAKDAPACPHGDALNAQLAKLFGVKEVTDGVCVAGHFPQPGWYVNGRFPSTEPDSSMVNERVAMVDAAGKVTFKDDNEIPPGAADASGTANVQVVDFDKDGTDELVYVDATDRRGYDTQTLVVEKWVKGKWEHAFDRRFAYDNTAAEAEHPVSCEATWRIVSGDAGKSTIVVEPKGKPAKKDDECVTAKETYALGTDGKFAKR